MLNILLIIGIVLILIAYTNILIAYIIGKKQTIQGLTAFDIAKEITSNYNEINIVESKEITISKYNLKRQIIRFTPKTYDDNNCFAIAISCLLAGYSLARLNKDKYLEKLNLVFKHLDYINKSSLLVVLISLFTTTIGDAKIGLILLIMIIIYQYLIIEVTVTSITETTKIRRKILNPKDNNNIDKILNHFSKTNTILFITTLIFMLREILIILNFS